MRVVALDTETTGLNKRRNGASVCSGHRIVEIAAVEIINGVITGNFFHTHINPGQPIDQKAFAVHGLTTDFLRGQPVFKDVAQAFIDFITGADFIVIHNAPFDLAFIDQEFQLLHKGLQPIGQFNVIDTLDIARAMFPGVGNRLDDLCRRYSLGGRSNKFHGALEDARILAQVYLIIAANL